MSYKDRFKIGFSSTTIKFYAIIKSRLNKTIIKEKFRLSGELVFKGRSFISSF